MRIIRFLLKMVVFPVMMIVTVVQWFRVFIIGFSSAVFNILAGLFFLAAVLSYLLGLVAGPEALKMILAGFVIIMILVAGEAIVTVFSTARAGLRDFIRS